MPATNARPEPAKRSTSSTRSTRSTPGTRTTTPATVDEAVDELEPADWHRRVVDRSLGSATRKSIDRGAALIRAAAALLERSGGESFTVQQVADEAGQSLRTLYQYFESKDDLLLAVFEEAMRTYAWLITQAIAELDDPLDRLAGAVVAAARMPERSRAEVDAGLARLRAELAQVEPGLVARSQAPVTALLRQLYQAAAATGRLTDRGEQGAVWLLAALNSAYLTSQTLGNEYGVDLPDHEAYCRFCLQGLGAELDDGWYQRVNGALQVDRAPLGSGPGGWTA